MRREQQNAEIDNDARLERPTSAIPAKPSTRPSSVAMTAH